MKNKTISPKYDEFELQNILDDDNWKKLGVCEIECLSCIDYTPKTKTEKAISVENKERMDEINALLDTRKKASIKPKSELELIKEQNALLSKRLDDIENSKKIKGEDLKLQVDDDGRKKLEAKAAELGISFRASIGDIKLLKKIQEKEPEFTL